MFKSIGFKCAVIALSGAMAVSTAQAQVFEVKLGGKTLGSLSYAKSGRTERLKSTLNNTPLGVFNGTFVASSQSANGAVQRYKSTSSSSRKTRAINLRIKAGHAVETKIIPATEATNLSTPARAPQGVVDPVVAIGKLIRAKGCPGAMTIYDGRRAIALRPNGTKRSASTLECAIRYTVVAGPGHLSPLYISKVKMRVHYDLKGDAQTLTRMKLGSGLFNLVLTRKE